MKLTILAAILSTASAFAPSKLASTTTAIRMSDEAQMPPMEEPITPAVTLPAMSMALPFMPRPSALTGKLPGDVGFDPLGFAKTEADLMNYREAEIKHSRLAMLAAAGWPLSEVFDKKIAVALHLNPVVDAADRAPSLLNGGLGKISPLYWIACIAAAGGIEFLGMQAKTKSGYFPGSLGFDPLGAYPKNKESQERMQLAEIKNGRLAMIAIFAFAIQEFVTKQGVVDETPLFFFPLMQTIKMNVNSGYIQ